MRTESHLMLVRYKNEFAEGDAVLISYDRRQIEYARFNKGSVTAKKTETDEAMMSKIF